MASSTPLFRLKLVSTASASGDPHQLFVGPTKPNSLTLPRIGPPRPVLAFSSGRKRRSSPSVTKPSSNKEKRLQQKEKEENLDEDAFEALFSQLEEDLKNDDMSDNDGDDELSEEVLARLLKEFEDAVVDGFDDDKLSGELQLDTDVVESSGGDVGDDDDDDDDEEEAPLKLKGWQLRRLASALKIGRRKTSIKGLAGELGLDRAVVLELLRDPPSNLLLMCASLPDKVVPMPVEPTSSEPESKPIDSPTTMDVKKDDHEVKAPVHAMQNRWSAQKRLKKVQLETLERVYRRTKRPTNAMISSIVHVTNLPWKTVVKWFEEKRVEDGVPDKRLPYRRSEPEAVSTY